MTYNEMFSVEKAMFILRHGSAEGEHKYFEAIQVIEIEYNRQKAEIEKLEKELKNSVAFYKTAAIKEFAERLKEKTFYIGSWQELACVDVADIDNLVKEMVGDSND